MDSTPDKFFTRLQAGDLLVIPDHCSLNKKRGSAVLFSVVLRVDAEGGLYLSYPFEHRPRAMTYGSDNPFQWDPVKKVLLDKHGRVPTWYSSDIKYDPGGAKKEAEIYARVPRLENLNKQHQITGTDVLDLISQQPDLVAVIEGIVANGEAGRPESQLLLALEMMGVEFSRDQAVRLAYFMERCVLASLIRAEVKFAIRSDETGGIDQKSA